MHWSSDSIISTNFVMSFTCDVEHWSRTFNCRCILNVAAFRRDVDCVGDRSDGSVEKETSSLGDASGSQRDGTDVSTVICRSWRSRACARSPMEQEGGVGNRAGVAAGAMDVGETSIAAPLERALCVSSQTVRRDAASKE
jgi:hypothetical protein